MHRDECHQGVVTRLGVLGESAEHGKLDELWLADGLEQPLVEHEQVSVFVLPLENRSVQEKQESVLLLRDAFEKCLEKVVRASVRFLGQLLKQGSVKLCAQSGRN